MGCGLWEDMEAILNRIAGTPEEVLAWYTHETAKKGMWLENRVRRQ